MLGLAGLDPERLRQEVARSHTDAAPLVGRNLAPLVLGQVHPGSVQDPLYFMTDDDPSRGLDQNNFVGFPYDSVVQPNHIETVIARLADGRVWKYSRYFDNPQFWSDPGTPGQSGVQDVALTPVGVPNPADPDQIVPYRQTVKTTPLPDEYEMYDISSDPMELQNLAGRSASASQEALLAGLLSEQCQQKRLRPASGAVPGQPACSA